jgi:hypothetical protein
MLTFINLAFCPGSVQASHCEKKGHLYLLTCYRDLEQPAAEYIRQVPDGAYCTITATEEVFKNFENFGIRESLSMRVECGLFFRLSPLNTWSQTAIVQYSGELFILYVYYYLNQALIS